MKRAFSLPIIVIFALSLCLSASPLAAEERITNFEVFAEIGEDASLVVTERISIVAEGKEIKRGIIRSIPTDFTDGEGTRRRAPLELVSALLDGNPVEVQVSRAGERIEFRLGDPEKLLPPGEHVFEISYRTSGQLGFFTEHDELYWNVTGDDWSFVIEQASFRARLPGREYGEGFSSVEFYTGEAGEKGRDARALPDMTVESSKPFVPGTGFTVVFTWPKGIVSPPAEPAPPVELLGRGTVMAIHLGMPILLLAVMFILWWKWGRDPESRPAIPLFTPPEGVEAGFARYVRTMMIDDRSFAAMILGIAVKGALTIQETGFIPGEIPKAQTLPAGAESALKLLSKLAGKSFRLRLDRDRMNDAGLTDEERRITEDLFGATRTEVHLSSADAPVLMDAFNRMVKSFKQRGKPLLSTNLGKWLIGAALFEIYALSMFLLTITSGFVRADFVIPFLAASFLLVPLSIPVPSGKGRFSTKILLRFIFPGLFILFTFFLWYGGLFEGGFEDAIGLLGSLLSVGVLLVFKQLLKVRTEEGTRLNESIEGLRMFITAAEKHRLESLPPDETPKLFEKLLPYAFSLDVAETWANRFQNVLASAGYDPSWYSGDLNAFTSAAGVAAFASGFSSAVSSGTRQSGSDGGGSSGGGGGGGGGSGW
ncbi:MAG: DUF2207 domain-containing protein [Synergistaceae bacterium]|nr:DUF2207 domain-containing protein [Synergistota bacterium]NLM72155.1 DUF2207 domain-containing protein [Synergistaceae bacterium]